MLDKKGSAAIEDLLRRIQELEDARDHLKQQMLNRIIHRDQHFQTSSSLSPQSTISNAEAGSASFRQCPPLIRRTLCAGTSGRITHRSTVKLTEAQYLNILESIDLPISINDAQGILIYRNKAWDRLYGYTGAEVVGKPVFDLVVDPKDAMIAKDIIRQMHEGKSWTGEFPVRNKKGVRFVAFASNKTFFDENGAAVAILSITADSRAYQQQINPHPTTVAPCEKVTEPHPLQPIQSAIVSKISDLVNAVKVKCEGGNRDDGKYALSGEESSLTTDPEYTSENRTGSPHSLFSKAEWLIKNGMAWPWKGNEKEGYCFISETGRYCGQWLHNDYVQQMKSVNPAKVTNILGSFEQVYDIKWDELMIKECIGRGSYGSLYHAVWYGSDVALKIFSKQEYSHDLILSFWQEVSLMKKLRHPNILLFMGAVLSPHHLCIVTEFLCRGSLFQLLHRRNRVKLNWKHRVHMATDIARGMNCLHRSLPPIIHCDLKSSNILVDKSWTIKIGDFGNCRIKHESYVTRKEGIGTWMAPEVLRNEEADEKSDVYSYGVVLWELTTEKIPWDGLNTMQVIKTVGLMNQRLEIPKDVDPEWACLIKRCLSSEPDCRPTFQEILDELKNLKKKFAEASNQAASRLK